jgi:hypothetical protein
MLLFFSFVQRQIVGFSFHHLFLSSDCNHHGSAAWPWLQVCLRAHACCSSSCAATIIDWRRIGDPYVSDLLLCLVSGG